MGLMRSKDLKVGSRLESDLEKVGEVERVAKQK